MGVFVVEYHVSAFLYLIFFEGLKNPSVSCCQLQMLRYFSDVVPEIVQFVIPLHSITRPTARNYVVLGVAPGAIYSVNPISHDFE